MSNLRKQNSTVNINDLPTDNNSGDEGPRKQNSLQQHYIRDNFNIIYNLIGCLGLAFFISNLLVVMYAPSAGAWMAVAVGPLIAWFLFMLYFTEKSTMVIYSKKKDSITVFRYYAMGRKDVKMMRLGALVNVYPVEIKNQYGGTTGYNINLIFNDDKVLRFFTTDQQNYYQYVDEIDDFCLNGQAPRNTSDDGNYFQDCCNQCCNGCPMPDHCNWLFFSFTFMALAYIGIFFLIAFAYEGANWWNEDGVGGIDRDEIKM